MIVLAVLGFLIAYPHSALPIRNFRSVTIATIPKTVATSICSDGTSVPDQECLADFRQHGLVWAGDVNGDGVDELIVFGGSNWAGSAGRNYNLFIRRGNRWESIIRLCENEDAKPKPCALSWQTMRLRTEILPIVRGGYHDLRIEVDHCIKWDGVAYVDYTPNDYHQLLPAWFNAFDPNEAEIFWAIRYAGLHQFRLEPQWFPINPVEFRESDKHRFRISEPSIDFPRFPVLFLDDPLLRLHWVGMMRGGMWGVRGNRAFLLNPQLAYLGTGDLRLQKQWLCEFEFSGGDAEEPQNLMASYNRITQEFRFEQSSAEDRIAPEP